MSEQLSTRPLSDPSSSTEPYYRPVGDEVELFAAAYRDRLPVMLKGPTGCGKTRFLEHMAYTLRGTDPRTATPDGAMPLVTVACHEELTAGDLVGRYLLNAQGSEWVDGPLTSAVKNGGICYLDEVVEARKDTIVIIHSLTDHRRILPIAKLGVVLEAHPDFVLVASYNPRYQSAIKSLKHSTRQRFVAIEFGYPQEDAEAEIICREAGVESELGASLAALGAKIRNLGTGGLLEGPSTRLLIYAARLVADGVSPRRACESALTQAMTDDPTMQVGVREVINAVLPR